MKKLVLFVALLLATITLQAGELVFHWNKMAESKVYDLEFYPDNNYFILCTANDIQITNTDDGEIFKTYQFGATDIEFTPDSSKILLILTGEETGRIQIRNTSDMSMVKEYTLPADSNGLYHFFEGIAVDPKRPYFYTVTTRTGEIEPGNWFTERKILVLNYETMEVVNELIPSEPINVNKKLIAISVDGKYLSVINQGESYIKTFDLNTQKEVQSFKVCESYTGGNSGAPVCIKFSEINSDKIYFSGNFPQSVDDHYTHYGLFVYSISENKIIDSSFGVGSETVYPGYFTFIDKNEERMIYTNGLQMFVINLFKHIKEITGGIYYINKQILYSKSNDIILGRGGENYITKLTYKNGSAVINELDIYKTIYPNPTNGSINIELNCASDKNNYELFDLNGLLIKSATIDNNSSLLQIDLSSYPNSIYFIKIYCGSYIRTYKIIKEN